MMRLCRDCDCEITAAFGFVCSDSYALALEGKLPMTPEHVREICGRCVLRREAKEPS